MLYKSPFSDPRYTFDLDVHFTVRAAALAAAAAGVALRKSYNLLQQLSRDYVRWTVQAATVSGVNNPVVLSEDFIFHKLFVKETLNVSTAKR